ncbi:MAG: LCP family protein [Oscillospiraceae bacterium]|nr:LCP family protein [Oscillospiraceae bacterium]
MNSPKSGKLRYFILAFSGAFLVLALMGLVAVHLLAPTENTASSAVNSADTFYLPDEKDDLSLFLVCRDEKAQSPLFFTLIRLDMLGGQIPVCFFPAETALNEESGFATLQQAYSQKGAPSAAKALADTYSIDVSRWAEVDSADLTEAIDRMGAIDYTLGEDLSYQDGELFLSLSAGRQILDGQKFCDILRYPAWQGGPTRRCEEGAKLICALLNQRLPTLLSDETRQLAGALLDLADTDLSYLDYEERLPALSFLLSLQGEAAVPCPIFGSFTAEGVFLLDALSLRLLVQNFA